ncbi:CcdB family protein [Sulfuricurvum sp.]|uniref:CcdB family protein n=1 Tax=Sulfuricurvum sp. TaxID=2025608 RepID=UPI003BB5A282
MAQFDVYRNINPSTSEELPYLIDIQAQLLNHLSTCVVIPFSTKAKALKHLNPIFVIEEKNVVLMTQEMAGIERALLGERVVSLSGKRSEIIGAVDFLISGF